MLDYSRAANRVLDPFCGHGTLLHVAEELGVNSVGVDSDPACCEAARIWVSSRTAFARWQYRINSDT